LIAIPAIVAATWVAGIEGYRLIQPESPLFQRGEPLESLAQAITVCCRVEDAYAFIKAGRDPNERLTVDDPEYAGDGSITVSPLMLAVAAGNGSVALMLLNAGARPDLPDNRLAGCLARALGEVEMVSIVVAFFGEDAQTACPPRAPDDPRPLLRWVVDESAAVSGER
jgi:hypothetical protein